ncbi:MAG: hypothetical protein R2695_18995 [Acidimicrobiales bacterium]
MRPDGFVLPDEFVAHSPRLEVPLVRVDGDYLADSIPILFWLDDVLEAPRPCPDELAPLVRERVNRLDELLMLAMGGIAHGRDPAKIEQASDRLTAAFVEMAGWLAEDRWLAGPEPTLAEAIAVPVYLRLEGLTELGFRGKVPAGVHDHRDRLAATAGGRRVAWSDAQRAEYLGRHRRPIHARGCRLLIYAQGNARRGRCKGDEDVVGPRRAARPAEGGSGCSCSPASWSPPGSCTS